MSMKRKYGCRLYNCATMRASGCVLNVVDHKNRVVFCITSRAWSNPILHNIDRPPPIGYLVLFFRSNMKREGITSMLISCFVVRITSRRAGDGICHLSWKPYIFQRQLVQHGTLWQQWSKGLDAGGNNGALGKWVQCQQCSGARS